MPKKTIRDVEQLGYSIGIAHGSVQAEEDALAGAKQQASAAVIGEQARVVTDETIEKLSNAGQLPDDHDERRQLAVDIATAALDQLNERASERVAHHERALEIAKDMPDVWVISGPGVTSVYVACSADGTGIGDEEQAFLDALADPEAHRERCFQANAPDAVVALALEARTLGADVQGDGSEDSWTLAIDGKDIKTEAALEAVVEPMRDEVPAEKR